MGGYGSGSCLWRGAKDETDDALRLDVRWLARIGCVLHAHASPAAARWCDVTWSRGGTPFASIAVRHDPWPADALTLRYSTRARGGEWRDVVERIELDRTACTYGGDRPWFRCPNCGARCAVLWSVVGRFACRRCNDLAYSSTRETLSDRMLRRADRLQAKLKWNGRQPGHWFGGVFDPPPKPKGMHWRTYERLCAELWRLDGEALRALTRDREALLARLDRSLARRTGGRA